MRLDSKRIHITISLILAAFFIIGSSYIINQQLKLVDKDVSIKSEDLSKEIETKLIHIQSYMNTLRDNFQQNIEYQQHSKVLHSALSLFKNNQDLNVTIIEAEKHGSWFDIGGVLLASGSYQVLDMSSKQEMTAVLYSKSIFINAVKTIPDIKWAYYISKDEFMYYFPYFDPTLIPIIIGNYEKEYWYKANPENNPDRRMVMTKIYSDAGGKGELVTFSIPVYFQNDFRGILAIDLSFDKINNLLAQNHFIGKSYLVDEKNIILASNKNIDRGKKLNIKENILARNETSVIIKKSTAVFKTENFEYRSFDVIKDEVRLIHQLDLTMKFQQALKNSMREIFLLLSSVLMAYMIYYSRVLVSQVRQLANVDSLTSLLNRRAMEEAVLPLISLNNRHNQKMCFLLADIDYFKKINDTFGHSVGDEVLTVVSSILVSCLRKSDLISRHGGEEFLIVLPQTPLESGTLLAERIRTSIENTRATEQHIGVTISLGCIELESDEDYDLAINRADKMLYKAKHHGRNRTVSSIDN